jgi:biopolymer transport protein ExbD
MSIERLEKKLRAEGIPSRPVRLEADSQVPYATIMRVLDVLRGDQIGHDDLPSSGYREQMERFGHPKD